MKTGRHARAFQRYSLRPSNSGAFRGIVVIIAGSSPEAEYIPLARELIKRDFLVVISGGIPPDTEMARYDGVDAGLTELCDFIGISPIICMRSPADHADMLNFFARQADLASTAVKDLPWAAITVPSAQGTDRAELESACDIIFSMGADPLANADLLDETIHEKRLRLDWCDRFHCSEETYS